MTHLLFIYTSNYDIASSFVIFVHKMLWSSYSSMFFVHKMIHKKGNSLTHYEQDSVSTENIMPPISMVLCTHKFHIYIKITITPKSAGLCYPFLSLVSRKRLWLMRHHCPHISPTFEYCKINIGNSGWNLEYIPMWYFSII